MAKKIEIMDGNQAAAYISYAFTEVAGIFPSRRRRPWRSMWTSGRPTGRRTCSASRSRWWRCCPRAAPAGTVHGSLQSGALTTTYTASQGLLLMIPNMYKIAGEMLPGVFHVSARTLSAHALSIFGDHSDVLGVRQTGFSLLASSLPPGGDGPGRGGPSGGHPLPDALLHFFDGFPHLP